MSLDSRADKTPLWDEPRQHHCIIAQGFGSVWTVGHEILDFLLIFSLPGEGLFGLNELFQHVWQKEQYIPDSCKNDKVTRSCCCLLCKAVFATTPSFQVASEEEEMY